MCEQYAAVAPSDGAIIRLGTRPLRDPRSVMFWRSRVAGLRAETASGTSCSRSSRRRAVTTTSSRALAARAAAAGAPCAWALANEGVAAAISPVRPRAV